MDSNEFDTYLSLLGKFLRLSEGQRKSLTDELRDHLESRTEDLVAAGVSPTAAIHQALDELGDVAGLAHQFLFVSRLQKRRRIMKWSLGTAAIVVTIFCLVTFGRNERPGAPNGAPLVAQAPTKAEVKAPASGHIFGDEVEAVNPKVKSSASKKILSIEENNARLDRILDNEATKFDFTGATLEEVCEFIRNEHKFNIQIDKASIGKASEPVDATSTKFDMHIVNVRLRTALDLLLKDHQLTYKIYDGVLIVISEEDAKLNLIRKVYPRSGTFAQIEARRVYSLITSSIYPGSWICSESGAGALNILPDRIIVSNTEEVHRELTNFWKQNDSLPLPKDLSSINDTYTEGDFRSDAMKAKNGESGGGGLF